MRLCRTLITASDLLERNYNAMNQWFLAIVVKIPASIFTIPMRFADLNCAAQRNEREDRLRVPVAFEFIELSIRVNHAACFPPIPPLFVNRAGEQHGSRRSPPHPSCSSRSSARRFRYATRAFIPCSPGGRALWRRISRIPVPRWRAKFGTLRTGSRAACSRIPPVSG
jgi:hypothetical protein